MEIDRARFGLWAQQARVDAATRRRAGLSGDVATLEWLLDTLLERLRGDLTDGELSASAGTAAKLRKTVSGAPMAG